MAKTNVGDWDETAANNTDVGGIDIAENCAPSGINNAMREKMAQIKSWFKTSLFRLRDSTDQTKLVAFDLSAITTGTTRTITMPDSNVNLGGLSQLTPGTLFGLTLSNNSTDATNDIDIAAGSARDSTDAENIVLASAITKRLDAAWAVGTGNGGLDTGSIADTTYHVWLIKRSDTDVVDVLFSTSVSAPTMPTSYDYKRRIGSIIRSSGAIRAFTQKGDEFLLKVPVLDVSVNALGTTATNYALTVPVGTQFWAKCFVSGTNGSGNWAVLVTSLYQTDTAAAYSGLATTMGFTDQWNGTLLLVRSNTTAQIRAVSSQANQVLRITTYGWIDTRGREE